MPGCSGSWSYTKAMHLGNKHRFELSACEMQFVKDKLHVARTDSNRYKHICIMIDITTLPVTNIAEGKWYVGQDNLPVSNVHLIPLQKAMTFQLTF